MHRAPGSDQTSLHLPFAGGCHPVGLTLEASNRMMSDDPAAFKESSASLRRHVTAVNTLVDRGMYFWTTKCSAGAEPRRADIMNAEGTGFDIRPMSKTSWARCTDYGLGPFRWVCRVPIPRI